MGRIGYDDECIERTVLRTKPFGGRGSQNKQSPYVLTGQKVQVARSVPGSDSRVQPDIIMSHRNVHAHQHKCGSLLPTREYIDETDGVRQPTSVLDLTKKGVGGGGDHWLGPDVKRFQHVPLCEGVLLRCLLLLPSKKERDRIRRVSGVKPWHRTTQCVYDVIRIASAYQHITTMFN